MKGDNGNPMDSTDVDVMAPSGSRKKRIAICSTRVGLAIVLFFGFVVMYCMRVNLSVGMVCMVNHSALIKPDTDSGDETGTTIQSNTTCSKSTSNTSSNVQDGPMVWSKDLQGLALSSFFWGYVVTQVPGGWLAEKYGSKIVLLVSFGGGSVLTMLMPMAARVHYGFFVALRVLLGVMQGLVLPSAHMLWSRWAPPMEKSSLIGFSYAGMQLGVVIVMPLSGALCVHGFDGGWPSVFYVFGIFGFLWTILWFVFGASSPKEHRFISDEEKSYIEKAIDVQSTTKNSKTPWIRIVTSMPVWAIVIMNCTSDFCLYVFLTNLPTYMKENLGFGAETGGSVSALPYIGLWILMGVSGFIADSLIRKKCCSIRVVRRIFNSIALLTSGIVLFGLTFVGCGEIYLTIFLLVLGVSIMGALSGGYLANHIDIAPEYAGILMGISNSFGTVSGMVAPALIGVMTQEGTARQWHNVFYLTFGIVAFGAIFDIIFGAGKIQSWAKAASLEDEDTSKPLKDASDEAKV